MTDYLVVGSYFCMGKTGRTFGGPCVLGPDAIHLIVKGDVAMNQLNTGHRGVAGLMDRAQGLVQLVPIAGIDQYELTMDELIDLVGDDPGWPKEIAGERAFVFPKSSVTRLRFGPLAGLNFRVDGHIRVHVSSAMKQHKPGVAYLQKHGWPVDGRSLVDRIRRRAA